MSIKEFRDRPWHTYKKDDVSFTLEETARGHLVANNGAWSDGNIPSGLEAMIPLDDIEGYLRLLKDMKIHADENGFRPTS